MFQQQKMFVFLRETPKGQARNYWRNEPPTLAKVTLEALGEHTDILEMILKRSEQFCLQQYGYCLVKHWVRFPEL